LWFSFLFVGQQCKKRLKKGADELVIFLAIQQKKL